MPAISGSCTRRLGGQDPVWPPRRASQEGAGASQTPRGGPERPNGSSQTPRRGLGRHIFHLELPVPPSRGGKWSGGLPAGASRGTFSITNSPKVPRERGQGSRRCWRGPCEGGAGSRRCWRGPLDGAWLDAHLGQGAPDVGSCHEDTVLPAEHEPWRDDSKARQDRRWVEGHRHSNGDPQSPGRLGGGGRPLGGRRQRLRRGFRGLVRVDGCDSSEQPKLVTTARSRDLIQPRLGLLDLGR